MECFCLKNVYDFYIEAYDSNRLIYTDLSEWMTDEPYIIPEFHEIKITPPGKKSEYTVLVKPLSTTIIESNSIGLSKLKDGVYKFSIEGSSPDSGGCGKCYTKNKAVFPKLECCINNAFSTLPDSLYNDIKESEKMLLLSKKAVELQQFKQAEINYQISKSLIEKLNCDCN